MKTWIIVLIAVVLVLVVGAIIIPLPKPAQEGKECSLDNLASCDISCNVDEDCKYLGNYTCINKNELTSTISGQVIKTMENVTLEVQKCRCVSAYGKQICRSIDIIF